MDLCKGKKDNFVRGRRYRPIGKRRFTYFQFETQLLVIKETDVQQAIIYMH